ncbi:MAG: GAF domain-containing protein, partial [Planctomycetes bacterium]|nr:GAF domain-containing protein [Planctomycetota bacterium]
MSKQGLPEDIPGFGLTEPTLAALADLGAHLADQTEPEQMQAAVLAEAARLLGVDCGAVAVWNDQDKSLVPGEVLGRGQVLVDAGVFANRTVTGHVVNRHLGVCYNDPGKQLSLGLDGVSALLVVPMVTGQRVSGAMALASTSAGRRFDERDQSLLQIVANFAASVLDSTLQFRHFSDSLRLQIVEVTREMNRAMAELAQVKSFNENIFESISMGIVVFDRSFGVIFRNRLADELFPDDRNVLTALGRTGIASRYEQYEPIFRDVVRLGQICLFDGVRRERAGQDEPLILRLSSSPLVGGRQAIVGGILTVEDVTRNVTMEQRLATSERLAAVGKLAAKVAHELNNPLDGILRYISLADRVCADGEDKRPAKYLEEARKGLRRMARIVGELLEFSRSTNDMAEAVTIRQSL